MKLDELHLKLRTQFNDELGYGVEKVDDPKYSNVWFVVPKPLPRSREFMTAFPQKQLLECLSKARRVFNESKQFSEMDELDKLVALLINRQEALASSRIEGTYSTIDEVFDDPTEDETEDYSDDTLSVIGYARSMEELVLTISKMRYSGITHELFSQMHKAIMGIDRRYDGIPGAYRTPGKPHSIVQIGGLRRKEESTYNPAPPRHVSRLMDEFLAWLSDPILQEEDDAGLGIPLPLRMVLAHSHFEAIHPFPDGNGRVGRMIWPIQMILAGISPIHLSGYIEENRDGYYGGLQALQKQLDPLPLLDYIGDALVGSKLAAGRTKEAVLNLPSKWRGQITSRKGSASERLLPHLLATPVLGVNEVMKHLNVTLPSAMTALKQLEKDGILVEKSGRKRKQRFAAEEVLAIVGRKFGTSPEDALELLREKKGT